MTPGEREWVEFQCGCGATFRAPASAAGRKARCPKCQQVLVLGKPATAEAHASAAGHADAASSAADCAPSDAGRVKMHCACGAGLAVPASAVGRKAKCPKCGQTLTVPPPTATATKPSNPAAGDLDFDSMLAGLRSGEAVAVSRPPPVVPASQRPSGGEDLYGLTPLERRPQETPAAAQGKPQTCPSCGKTFPGGAKICVECGVNLKTGRALITTQDENLDRIYVYAENLIRVISWVFWYGIYPIASEAFGLRKPWVTRGIAVVTILVSVWYMVVYIFPEEPSYPSLKNLMLWSGQNIDVRTQLRNQGVDDTEIDAAVQAGLLDLNFQPGEYRSSQLFTHALLHSGPIHLLSNLLFLMVLGSRVNALIGNVLMLILYPLLAVASGLAYMASTADEPLHPMLGASGAIMGLAGMYLVLFPVHKVHMALWWRWGLIGLFTLHMKTFAVRGFWVVLFYIAFDVIFTVIGLEDNVAHWAHLGGFLTGAGVAFVLLFSRLVNARGGDLLTAILGRHAWGLIGKPNRPGLSLW